jgi:uncharacterized protein (TIGR02391 family)
VTCCVKEGVSVILTDDDIRNIRQVVEDQAGLDKELVDRCSRSLRSGAVEDAVRSAFVVLERRLRRALGVTGGKGVDLSRRAFNPDTGVLARRLDVEPAQKEGLRDLFVGAFMAYRNPAAHGRATYTVGKGKAIIALVNLLLMVLDEIPPPAPVLPPNVLTAISHVKDTIDEKAARRLRRFLEDCMRLGLTPYKHAKEWIPFRTYCVRASENDPKPKRMRIAVFYIAARGEPRTRVLVDNQFSYVADFDTKRLTDDLERIGFQRSGAWQEPHVNLRTHHDKGFFDALFDVVKWAVAELEATLQDV